MPRARLPALAIPSRHLTGQPGDGRRPRRVRL